MFLVTTADQRFWKTDEKILFLGEWCKIYDQKHIWSKLDYKVLPYHWDDRNRLYKDYLFLDSVYEKYLQCLADQLNALHGEEHSLRYWRILIGFWLQLFIHSIYDKYLSIREALDSKLVTHTLVLPSGAYQWIARDLASSRSWMCGMFEAPYASGLIDDRYNQYIYGRIIKWLGVIPYEVKEDDLFLNSTKKNSSNSFSFSHSIKRVAGNILSLYGRGIPDRWNQIVFGASYLKIWDLIRLQLALGQFPYPYAHYITPREFPIKPAMRETLKFSKGTCEFELFLDEIISEQVPKVYVEGYSSFRQKSIDEYPRNIRGIFSAVGLISNEGFKFWSSEQMERGVKIIGCQHGGGYGAMLACPSETHELGVCDQYFTWGWEESGTSKTVPLPSGKLAGIQGRIKPNPKGKILWIGKSVPRYTMRNFSHILGPQMLSYIDFQMGFYCSVSPEARKLLLRRLPIEEFGWREKKRWEDIAPDLKVYQGKETMYKQLGDSRLCIQTVNDTTLLETLSINFPTIVFVDAGMFELRESARPYFDGLRQAGILYDTPESAAAKVNEIYQDPISWWNSPETQEAKDRLCHQFARTSDTWLSEWKKELLKLTES